MMIVGEVTLLLGPFVPQVMRGWCVPLRNIQLHEVLSTVTGVPGLGWCEGEFLHALGDADTSMRKEEHVAHQVT